MESALDHDATLTYEQEKQLGELQEQIALLLPDVAQRVQEQMSPTQQTM